MIDSFTAVITWIKSISVSVLNWFFDLSNQSKVLLFVVPLFVIAGIALFFDFIVPLFWDLPQWKLKKHLNVMTPKNTYGLQINKHLIPRLPYQFKKTGVYRLINHRNNKLNSFKTSDLKNFKIEDMRSFKVSDLKNFKTSDIRSFKSDDIRSLNPAEIRSFGSVDFKPLIPVKIDSFKVSEVRPLRVHDLRSFSLNSRIIASSSLRGFDFSDFYFRNFIGGNNLRVASPSYSINTNSDLTTLGHKVFDKKEEKKHIIGFGQS